VRNGVGSAARFPQRLLAVALVLTIVLTGSVGWHVSSAHGGTNDPQRQYLRIEQLSGVITHLDEVLTMSARMAATTGDRRWEDRYNAHVTDLDAAIKEAKRLAGPLVDAKELQDTDDANVRLVELETESFRLVRAGATDRAQALLFSDEYEEQKRIYAGGLALVVARLRADAANALRRERREAELLLATTVLMAVVLLIAWVVIIRSLHRWRAALRLAEREREERRAALQEQQLAELRERHALETLAAERRSAQALHRSEAFLRTIVTNAPLVLFAVDREGIVTLSEGKGLAALGLQPGQVVGSSVFDLYRDVPQIADDVRRALAGETVLSQVELGELAFEAAYGPVVDDDGELAGVIGVATNVTERRNLERRLHYRAFHDGLTDLANRALFGQRMSEAAAQGGRQRRLVAALFVDLDGFKAVNDAYGHEAGDQVLVTVAERLRDCVRPGDTAARLGGDEFGLLVMDLTDAEVAEQVAERVLAALSEPILLGEREVRIGASVGLAVAGAAEFDADTLLRNADLAMYVAKRHGKGRYERFEPGMHDAVLNRLALEADLAQAVRHGELTVVYQPSWSLQSKRIIGVEALVRWRHPTRGLVLPGDFIPIAEETGLIRDIFRLVLDEACRQARRWQERYPSQPPLTTAVNLSVRQLQGTGIVDEVAEALQASGLPPETLVLEITESVVMENLEAVIDVLRRLRGLGVRLALDDFGTGYSSLSYLQRLPVDILKIDRSFISSMIEDPEQSAVARAIVKLGQSLDLETVAEGIESSEQLAALRELGCHSGQGYYFARPSDPAAVELLLEHEQAAGHLTLRGGC
jgi:diguanylate cyclase (GGDEF)-like protein/PAS domain S-box-containing protein